MTMVSDDVANALHAFIGSMLDRDAAAEHEGITRTGATDTEAAAWTWVRQSRARRAAAYRLLRMHRPVLLPVEVEFDTGHDSDDRQAPAYKLGCSTCRDDHGEPFDAPCWTLRLIASEWAHLPGFDPRWAMPEPPARTFPVGT